MYFNNTRKTENAEKLNNFVLKISNTSLPQVEYTKFLGVIIVNNHLGASLTLISKKLSCCTGISHFTIHSLKPLHKPLSQLI